MLNYEFANNLDGNFYFNLLYNELKDLRHSYHFYIVLTCTTRHNAVDVSRNMIWVDSHMGYFHVCVSSYVDK